MGRCYIFREKGKVSNMGNPDWAGRKAFIKVYEDTIMRIFGSHSVFETAVQEFEKAWRTLSSSMKQTHFCSEGWPLV